MSILGKIILWFFGSIVAFAIVYLLIELITSIRKKRLAAPHLALINHENPEVREAAIMALGEIGHKSAVPALIKALNDPNSSVRAAAAQALGKIHDQESLPGLTQTAIHDEVAQVRFASVEALRLIGRIYENYIERSSYLHSIIDAQRSQELALLIDRYILPSLMMGLKDEDSFIQEVCALALANLGIPEPAIETMRASRGVLPDIVQFSAYYPEEILAKRQYRLHVFAHLEDETVEIEKEIDRIRLWVGDRIFKAKRARQAAPIVRGMSIGVVPESEEIRFSPPISTQQWNGKRVWFQFDFQAPQPAANPIQVRVSIQVAGIEIAHIPIVFKFAGEKTRPPIFENPLAAAKYQSKTATIYQNIFISYSRKDREIVEACRLAQLAIGNDVFVDTYSIRSGANWRAVLAQAIDLADIFQLFWSKSSAASENVRDEWDYALKYRCPETRCIDFIRPVYWEQPIPVKPPAELGHLNFKYLPLKSRFAEKRTKKLGNTVATAG
jgi:hypothetical protein